MSVFCAQYKQCITPCVLQFVRCPRLFLGVKFVSSCAPFTRFLVCGTVELRACFAFFRCRISVALSCSSPVISCHFLTLRELSSQLSTPECHDAMITIAITALDLSLASSASSGFRADRHEVGILASAGIGAPGHRLRLFFATASNPNSDDCATVLWGGSTG